MGQIMITPHIRVPVVGFFMSILQKSLSLWMLLLEAASLLVVDLQSQRALSQLLQIQLQIFPVKALRAQILVVDHLAVVFAALAATTTARVRVQVTVQAHVAEAALVHASILALVHAVALARITALVPALAVMVVAVVAVVAVAIVPAVAGKVTALVHALSTATMKLLAVVTVIASVPTFHGKDWRLAHGRTNYSSNG